MKQLDIYDVLEENKKILPEVIKIKGKEYKLYNLCYYAFIDFYANVEVYHPVNINLKDVKNGYEYLYKKIDDILYKRMLTNDVRNYHLTLMDELSNEYLNSVRYGLKQNDDIEGDE